jgi:N-ethylmaleimide reductase
MTLNEDSIPTFDYIIEKLSTDYNLAYIHLSEPFTNVSDVPHAELEIAKRYRPKYKGTLMINAGFNLDKANEVIEEGDADLVAFGKLYVSNPDLVGRFRDGVERTAWDKTTFYTQGTEGYLDYEARTRELIPE